MTESYKLLSLLGKGGFSEVFLAEHRETGDRVAIKILSNAAGDARFGREAGVLQTLESPNTVRLLEFGRSAQGPFMVFEFVEGAEDLAVFLERQGRVDWMTAVTLLRQMLRSLAEAHGIGVVHRDVKPANMLLTPDGTIKVIDFGLVRLSPTLYDVTPLTQTGKVLGTPRYMAPEVLRASQAAAPRADVFAVGMIAYQLIVGEHANPGRSAYEVIARHLDADPYELPEHTNVPFALRAWIEAMVRKDWRRRIPDAATALAELDQRLKDTAFVEPPRPVAATSRSSSGPSKHAGEALGDRVISEFALGEELGRGATAAVWSARHRRFGGRAAVKFLLAGANEAVRGAFFAEARAHAGLDHPNVVRLLDYGHVHDGDAPPAAARRGDPYLVMELARGTLREAGLPTSWFATLHILGQVLEALAYAHARGVIHRDLKPENVLCFDDGSVKVSDFGIAHSLRACHRGTADTLAESIGTPRYMSPEQFRGHAHDFGPATDLYALGCMAYELVVGRVPFAGPRLVDIAQQHQSQPMPAPIARFEVPEGFAAWLARLLAKRPQDRFETAADASWHLFQMAQDVPESTDAAAAEFLGASEPTFVAGSRDAALELGSYLTVRNVDYAPTDHLVDEGPSEVDGVVEPGPCGPPPMLATWRRAPRQACPLVEGLGLFSLRELPLAGQNEARDVLWGALQKTQETGELAPVVLDGGRGSPVSQLGSWFAARAVETGAAHAVFVSHTIAGAPREGLAAAIEDMFGTWALDNDEAVALIRERLSDDVASDVASTDAQVLAQELLRARGSGPGGQSGEHERFAALARVLRRRARSRPLVLFVDHIQVSSESTGFVRYLLDEEPDLSAVIVLGKRAASSRASLERDIATLVEDERCQVVTVAPYNDDEYFEFAALLLPMTPEFVRLLGDATGCDPALTQLCVADLIDRGLLEQRDGAFAPVRELTVDEMLPGPVITRRVERLSLDAAGRQGLIVCAILSEAPDIAEVAAVCEQLEMPVADTLGPRLDEVGLARSSGAGWWFTPGVTNHLLNGVTKSEQRRIRRACGHALLRRVAPDDAEGWSRAARFFIAAGDAADALEPLYRAVRLLVTRDLETAETLTAQRGALIGMLGSVSQSTAWIDQLNLLSVIAKTHGDRKQAMEHIEAAHDLAVEAGYARGLARALRDSAAVAVDLGSLGEAAARFDRAAEIAGEAGDLLDEAHAWFGAGFVEYRRANLAAAERHYLAAIVRFEEVGASQARARAMSYLSALYVAAGRFDEAREKATAAQEIARSCGALAIVAETKSDLAEIARFTGDYELARKLYEENARWQRLAGSRSIGAITRLNLALVDLGAGRYADAMDSLEALEQEVRELGLVARLPLVRVARLAAIVGNGGDEAEDALRQSGELFAVSEPDRDIAWAYECGAHAAAYDASRRQWFRERATAEYQRLGDDTSAHRVAAM